ncbi:outer membrane lipoprotein carrier protein LolA [Inquilinus sp. CAU 1745]|uniref:LolA family protein n=1 Tax=Inquilinus sp. CAU 1745 TaxID=3140369 RepID=UPI00325B4A2E
MKKILASLTLAASLAITAAPLPAAAQSDAAELSDAQQATVERIEGYLNSITTMQARFTQTAENGGVAEGDFYLSRPGRMRIEYDELPYLYVADGFWLTYYDKELGQRSDALLGSSLADFITRPDIELSGDVTVRGVRDEGGRIEIDIVQTSDPGAGMLTLVFTDSPLRLDSWIVADAAGLTTEIQLSNARFGGQLSSSLFVAPRPD